LVSGQVEVLVVKWSGQNGAGGANVGSVCEMDTIVMNFIYCVHGVFGNPYHALLEGLSTNHTRDYEVVLNGSKSQKKLSPSDCGSLAAKK
jgi:hypothetical protein